MLSAAGPPPHPEVPFSLPLGKRINGEMPRPSFVSLSLSCDPAKIWAVYRGLTVGPHRAAIAAGAVAATPELEAR